MLRYKMPCILWRNVIHNLIKHSKVYSIVADSKIPIRAHCTVSHRMSPSKHQLLPTQQSTEQILVSPCVCSTYMTEFTDFLWGVADNITSLLNAVPYVPYVPSCLRCWRALVSSCLNFRRALVPSMLMFRTLLRDVTLEMFLESLNLGDPFF